MIIRTQQILENFGQIVDINEIKEITKKKDITKIINNINKLGIEYNTTYLKFYVYKNIYIIYELTKKIYYIYDKEGKKIIRICSFYVGYTKYCCENNNNIMKIYDNNKFVLICIFRHKKLEYTYNYRGRIKNDKYKANNRLIYICFDLLCQ
jgi:hypothetical protein